MKIAPHLPHYFLTRRFLERALVAVLFGTLMIRALAGASASQLIVITLVTLPFHIWALFRGHLLDVCAIVLLGMIASIGSLFLNTNLSTDQLLLFLSLQVVVFSLALQGKRYQRLQVAADGARRSQARLLEELIAHSPALLYVKDQDGRYLLVSDSYARAIERPREQIVGFTVDEIYPAQSAQEIRDHDLSVLSSLEPGVFEESIAGDERGRTFLSVKAPFYDANGRAIGIACSAIDITERKQTELLLRETESRFAALANLPLVGIYTAQAHRLVYVNDKLADITGQSAQQLIGQAVTDVFPADIRAARVALNRCRTPDGSDRYLIVQTAEFTYRRELTTIGLVLDVTEQERALDELRLTAKVFENTADAILVTDPKGVIVTVNPAFERITGFTEAASIGHHSRLFRDLGTPGSLPEDCRISLLTQGHWQGEMQDVRRDGRRYVVSLSISAVQSTDEDVAHYVVVFSDVTVRKQTEARLQFLANHDPMTGLPNRSMFLDRLESALQVAAAQSSRLALLFVDLDRFKLINDSLGHEAGDQILSEVARRFQDVVTGDDLVARLGGDEFIVMLPDIRDPSRADQMAARLIDTMQPNFLLQEREYFLSCSIGISLFPLDGDNAQVLLKHADAAMYYAKELGKNNYQFFSSDMKARAEELLMLETQLRRAIRGRELTLVYQPQIGLADGRMVGAEALIRWNHPVLGQIAPSRFIPMAEETGLIVELGDWVLETACQQAKDWFDAGLPPLRVSVNLSARQFHRETLAEKVESVLKRIGLPGEWLELEITETMLMIAPEEAVGIMNALRRLGVTLAIDDFGTGYSSLNHLKRFPIQALKIDQSFVAGIPHEVDDMAITETIITLAKQLKMIVIAEGVETTAQMQFLARHHCDIMQGNLCGLPLTAAEFTDLFRSDRVLMPMVRPSLFS